MSFGRRLSERATVTSRRQAWMRRVPWALGLIVCLPALWIALRVGQGALALRDVGRDLGARSARVEPQSALLLAQGHAQQARSAFNDPLVDTAAAIPLLGDPLEEARRMAGVVVEVVNNSLPPLVAAAGSNPAGRLLQGHRVNLAFLAALREPAERTSASLSIVRGRLTQIPATGFPVLSSGRLRLAHALTQLQTLVDGLDQFARLAPELLGASGAKNYLLIPQNPAEARGTGGLVGGYVTVTASRGVVSQTGSGPSTSLFAFRYTVAPVVDLGADFSRNYVGRTEAGSPLGDRDPRTSWYTSNSAYHFPYAAQIWAGLWRQQTGQRVDGVLAMDPVALAGLLDATGPVVLPDGTSVTSKNAVRLMLVDAYKEFGSARGERKQYLQQVASAVARSLAAGKAKPHLLVTALLAAVRQHHLLFWSSSSTVERAIAGGDVAGELPEGAVAGDVVVSGLGNKLDYYLDRTLTLIPACAQGSDSTLELALHNGATQDLPHYVSDPFYLNLLPPASPPGTNRSLVSLYLPGGSVMEQLRVSGVSVAPILRSERGLVRLTFVVTEEPGRNISVRLDFRSRLRNIGLGRIRQALVRPETFRTSACR